MKAKIITIPIPKPVKILLKWLEEISKLKIVLILFLLASTFVFIRKAVVTITYPYPVDVVEGLLLDQALPPFNLKVLYRPDYTNQLVVPTAYPPVFQTLLAGLVAILGPAYWYARVLSFFAIVGSALCTVVIVFKTTKKEFLAWLAGGLFVSVPVVLQWTALVRVDFLALFFGLTSVVLVLLSKKEDRFKLVLAGLFAALAFFTRQTQLLTTIPFVLAAVFQKHGKQAAIQLALKILFFIGIPYVLLDLYTSGGFTFNIATVNAVMDRYRVLLDYFYGGAFIQMPLFVPALVIGIWQTQAFKKDASLYVYFVSAIAATFLMVKLGANTNYFVDLCAAIAILIPVIMYRSSKKIREIMFLLIILQIGYSFSLYHFMETQNISNFYLFKVYEVFEEKFAQQDLLSLIESADEPILIDDYSLGLLALAGKKLQVEPFAAKMMVKHGLVDPSFMYQQITDKKYELVIFRNYRSYLHARDRSIVSEIQSAADLKWFGAETWWDDKTYQLLYENYEPIYQIGGYIVMKPRTEKS